VSWVLLALGLVAFAEGLVLALAPSRVEQVLEILARLRPDQRRVIGLVSAGCGVALVALWRWTGA
jgi:uncharacterized protein